MNQPEFQKQHKIPEVYLKKFGYENSSNQWMLSVIQAGEKFTRYKK